MEGFTQFCIWFLFASVVIELGWKGWNKYNNKDVEVHTTESEFTLTIKEKDLEGEKKK